MSFPSDSDDLSSWTELNPEQQMEGKAGVDDDDDHDSGEDSDIITLDIEPPQVLQPGEQEADVTNRPLCLTVADLPCSHNGSEETEMRLVQRRHVLEQKVSTSEGMEDAEEEAVEVETLGQVRRPHLSKFSLFLDACIIGLFFLLIIGTGCKYMLGGDNKLESSELHPKDLSFSNSHDQEESQIANGKVMDSSHWQQQENAQPLSATDNKDENKQKRSFKNILVEKVVKLGHTLSSLHDAILNSGISTTLDKKREGEECRGEDCSRNGQWDRVEASERRIWTHLELLKAEVQKIQIHLQQSIETSKPFGESVDLKILHKLMNDFLDMVEGMKKMRTVVPGIETQSVLQGVAKGDYSKRVVEDGESKRHAANQDDSTMDNLFDKVDVNAASKVDPTSEGVYENGATKTKVQRALSKAKKFFQGVIQKQNRQTKKLSNFVKRKVKTLSQSIGSAFNLLKGKAKHLFS
uniref:uncharacterized protein n=1 Tax=Myxine glutinosa TaxID=7769 RepID=UPI00358FE254